MEPNDTLNELLRVEKKALRHARTRTVLGLVIALALVAGVILLLFGLRTLSTELIPVLRASKDTLSAASGAFRNLEKIDPETINSLAESLQGKDGGIAGALDNIAKLDPEAINNLLNRLEDVMNVMDRLSSVLESFSGLFGG